MAKGEVTLGLAAVCLLAGLALGAVLLSEGSTDLQGWGLVAVNLILGVVCLVQAKLAPKGGLLRRPTLTAEEIIARRHREPTYGRDTAIADLMRLGARLEAISLYREETGAGLSEAKSAVEAIERASGGKGGPRNGS